MAQGAGGLFVAVPDGFLIPFFRLFIVLLNAVAVGVAVAHIEHGCGVALFRRLKVPFRASSRLTGVPFPFRWHHPRLSWAVVCPCSAALVYQWTALAMSTSMPRPLP